MKYAIILTVKDRRYLIGFTNNETCEEQYELIPLKELSSLFIALEGDNSNYLS